MGAVYEATDEEIQRRAAIKILHAQYTANAEMASRFLNEARAVNIIISTPAWCPPSSSASSPMAPPTWSWSTWMARRCASASRDRDR